jgi:hypothetical protein
MENKTLETVLHTAGVLTDIIPDAEIYVLMNQAWEYGEYAGFNGHEVGVYIDHRDYGHINIFTGRVKASQ